MSRVVYPNWVAGGEHGWRMCVWNECVDACFSLCVCDCVGDYVGCEAVRCLEVCKKKKKVPRGIAPMIYHREESPSRVC